MNFAHEFSILNVDDAFDFFYTTLNQLIIENVPRKRIAVKYNKPKWWSPQLQRLKNRKNKLFKRKPWFAVGQITDEYVQALKDFDELHDKLYGEYMAENKDIYQNANENIMSEIDVSLFDIDRAIKKIKVKSSVGSDDLHPRIIRECADSLVFPIWLLSKMSFSAGKIPAKLKMSRIIPLFKKGDRSDVKNYRIIAICSVVLKVFEIVMHEKLLDVVNTKLSNAQHGFRPKRSVVTNLMQLSVAAHSALERRNQLDVLRFLR